MANIRIMDYNYEYTSMFMFMFNAASGNYGPNLIIGYHFFLLLMLFIFKVTRHVSYQRESCGGKSNIY